jgi:flagellar protein FlaF
MSTPYGNRYQSVPQPGNPTYTEAWALTQAAIRLSNVQREPVDEDAMLAAVRINWKLWTIFQADITAEDCALPQDLRMDMLSLCRFVDRHTVGILAKPKPDHLTVLININRNIAEGLKSGLAADDTRRAAAMDAAVAAGSASIKVSV